MSKFENERYNVFLRNIQNEEYLKINVSPKQEKALIEIRQKGRGHGLYDVFVLELIEDFVVNNHNSSDEMIDDLVKKTVFYLGGDYNYLYSTLKETYRAK